MTATTEASDLTSASAVLIALLQARTGQTLSPARTWRIEASLKPVMRDLGIESIDALVAKLTRAGGEALSTRIVEALLNNETSFFRDGFAFEQLETDALERLKRSRGDTRRLRIWSAACSTGQEPYSLAMMLRNSSHRWDGWTFDILATDISEAAVARGRAGRFTRFEIQRGLPVRTMLNWFREEGEEWIIDPVLRRDVRFAAHNLTDPAPGRFDLILCRNVLMYFAVPLRTQVLDRLADALDPGGILMLGAGETVIGQSERFASDPMLRGLYVAAKEVTPSRLKVGIR